MRVSNKSGVFTVLLCHLCSLTLLAQDCQPGWFGPDCQYVSHCNKSGCGLDFACPRDSLCDRGWFGPGCQYVDLVNSSKILVRTPSSVYTPVPNACRINCTATSLKVQLKIPYVITWIRIVQRSDSGLNFNIEVEVEAGDVRPLECTQVRLTQAVVDMFCEPPLAARSVVISGPAVGTVCSVFISGGRNIALKQETWQSTTTDHEGVLLDSSRAVDGNTNGLLRNTEKSCSNTKSSDPNPAWALRFQAPKRMYQFVLHNRDVTSLLIRLKGFTFTAFAENGTTLYRYKDQEEAPRREYTVTLESAVQPVKYIEIRASPQLDDKEIKTILSLCEVEIYGDSVCQQGTFGFECNCCCSGRNETCLVGEVGCLCVCQQGFTLNDEIAASEIGLFVWVGIGIAVLAIIITIAVVTICCSRRKTKIKRPHVYDVTNSNRQCNHEYNVLFKPETSNDETTLKKMTTTAADRESQLYDEVDDQYQEFD
ncbi:hypothetical protein BsWGS_03138 [Bradybaena similaris]